MDEGTVEITSGDTDTTDRVSPEDIEETRTAMSGTISAIADKVNPQALADQAKEVASDTTEHVKQAAADVINGLKETLPELANDVGHNFVSGMVGAAKKSLDGAVDGSKNAINDAVASVKGGGMSIIDHVKQKPLAALAVSAGLYWLFSSGNNAPSANGTASRVSDIAGKVQDKTGDLISQAGETAGQVADRVQETAQHGGDWFQRTMQDAPLAIGLAAVAAGVLIGLSVPETQAEHRMMGDTKDTLVQKAQDAVSDLGSKVATVAQHATDAVKEESQNQGLTAVASA